MKRRKFIDKNTGYLKQNDAFLFHANNSAFITPKDSITSSILTNMNCETNITDKNCKRFTEPNFVFCNKFPLKLLHQVYLSLVSNEF